MKCVISLVLSVNVACRWMQTYVPTDSPKAPAGLLVAPPLLAKSRMAIMIILVQVILEYPGILIVILNKFSYALTWPLLLDLLAPLEQLPWPGPPNEAYAPLTSSTAAVSPTAVKALVDRHGSNEGRRIYHGHRWKDLGWEPLAALGLHFRSKFQQVWIET